MRNYLVIINRGEPKPVQAPDSFTAWRDAIEANPDAQRVEVKAANHALILDREEPAPGKKARCPWRDYAGNVIHEGDKIQHPSGERGTVLYWRHEKEQSDRWRVQYEDAPQGVVSRLGLQIGDKGRAVVCGS